MTKKLGYDLLLFGKTLLIALFLMPYFSPFTVHIHLLPLTQFLWFFYFILFQY